MIAKEKGIGRDIFGKGTSKSGDTSHTTHTLSQLAQVAPPESAKGWVYEETSLEFETSYVSHR